MEFKPLEHYLFNYGTHARIGTFKYKERNINFFFDSKGEFALSDEFLAKGTILIRPIESENEEEGEDIF